MSVNLEKELAKQKSFVYKLTKTDIEKLLSKLGYAITKIEDINGKLVPLITKNYNKETKTFSIVIHCKKNFNKREQELTKVFFGKIHPIFAGVSDSYLKAISITTFILTDYIINHININEIPNLQSVYAHFMWDKFGDYYKTMYNKNVRQELKKQQNETQK